MRISDWSSDVCSSDLSVTTQQSRRCRGSLTSGDSSTSSMVTALGRKASGLYWAWWDAATLISASCSLVVPISYMWRRADRKSVVSGTRVVVRVDLGGRQKFKKQIR